MKGCILDFWVKLVLNTWGQLGNPGLFPDESFLHLAVCWEKDQPLGVSKIMRLRGKRGQDLGLSHLYVSQIPYSNGSSSVFPGSAALASCEGYKLSGLTQDPPNQKPLGGGANNLGLTLSPGDADACLGLRTSIL